MLTAWKCINHVCAKTNYDGYLSKVSHLIKKI